MISPHSRFVNRLREYLDRLIRSTDMQRLIQANLLKLSCLSKIRDKNLAQSIMR